MKCQMKKKKMTQDIRNYIEDSKNKSLLPKKIEPIHWKREKCYQINNQSFTISMPIKLINNFKMNVRMSKT